jgi:hypothetical protein
MVDPKTFTLRWGAEFGQGRNRLGREWGGPPMAA